MTETLRILYCCNGWQTIQRGPVQQPGGIPGLCHEPSCITYPSQPQGQFIYSPTAAQLGQAFLAISSQILRLSH
jgi:hypothetical protein